MGGCCTSRRPAQASRFLHRLALASACPWWRSERCGPCLPSCWRLDWWSLRPSSSWLEATSWPARSLPVPSRSFPRSARAGIRRRGRGHCGDRVRQQSSRSDRRCGGGSPRRGGREPAEGQAGRTRAELRRGCRVRSLHGPQDERGRRGSGAGWCGFKAAFVRTEECRKGMIIRAGTPAERNSPAESR